MGYDIFASGVLVQDRSSNKRLVYDKKDRFFGNEWEMPKLLDLGLSMKGFNTGGSISGGLAVEYTGKLAMSQFRRLIGQSLRIMALECTGQINIFTQQGHLLSPTESNYKRFYFNRSTVNTEFKKMLKFLTKVELNQIGPLGDMCQALSKLCRKGDGPGHYMFNVEYQW